MEMHQRFHKPNHHCLPARGPTQQPETSLRASIKAIAKIKENAPKRSNVQIFQLVALQSCILLMILLPLTLYTASDEIYA
jgi:hypothetical protein